MRIHSIECVSAACFGWWMKPKKDPSQSHHSKKTRRIEPWQIFFFWIFETKFSQILSKSQTDCQIDISVRKADIFRTNSWTIFWIWKWQMKNRHMFMKNIFFRNSKHLVSREYHFVVPFRFGCTVSVTPLYTKLCRLFIFAFIDWMW